MLIGVVTLVEKWTILRGKDTVAGVKPLVTLERMESIVSGRSGPRKVQGQSCAEAGGGAVSGSRYRQGW